MLFGIVIAPACCARCVRNKLNQHDTPGAGQIHGAIHTGIVRPLGLSPAATLILSAQSRVETGDWRAWYFAGPQYDGQPPTFNLWNRRAGSGRGEWTRRTKYVSATDPDVRIYTDVFQSARDMAQLLRYDRYRYALSALLAGHPYRYFAEIGKAGFAAAPDYVERLNDKYAAVVLALSRYPRDVVQR